MPCWQVKTGEFFHSIHKEDEFPSPGQPHRAPATSPWAQTPRQASPALVAAAHEVVLLHAVGEELRPAQGQADFGQQLGQEGLPLLPVVADPG